MNGGDTGFEPMTSTREYDIYFYQGLPRQMQQQGVQQRQTRNAEQSGRSPRRARGQKFFSISSRDGIEEVEIDLENAEQGWNLIGGLFYWRLDPTKLNSPIKTTPAM